MCTRFLRWAAAFVAGAGLVMLSGCSSATLRVCAEPDAMPYSNRSAEGFENKVAEMFARERGERLEYKWLEERRGSFDESLAKSDCDVVMGLPVTVSFADVTAPYYRSSYVFVYRNGEQPFTSMDDPRLKQARIGVQLIGDDFGNTPSAYALAKRNLIGNLAGYLMHSSADGPRPAAQLVDAVADGRVDVGIEWGPPAGYFAAQQAVPLQLSEVPSEPDLPFQFDIGIGVRPGAAELRAAANTFLKNRRTEIRELLASYHVPVVERQP